MIKMTHYYWKEGKKIVVQNAVMGYMGQIHKHTEKGFEKWKEGVDEKSLVNLDKE